MDESSVMNMEEPSEEEETPTSLDEHPPEDVQQQKALSALARATDAEALTGETLLRAEEIIKAGFLSAIRTTHGNLHEAEDALQDALEYLLKKGHYQRFVDENPEKLRAWLINKARNKAIDNHDWRQNHPASSLDRLEEDGVLMPADPVDVEDRLIERDIISNVSSLGLSAKGLTVFLSRMSDLGGSMSAADRKNLERYRAALLKHAHLEPAETDAVDLIRTWQRQTGWNTPVSAAQDFVRCAAGLSSLPVNVKERPAVPAWLAGLDLDGQTRALVRTYTSGLEKLSILTRPSRASSPEDLGGSEA